MEDGVSANRAVPLGLALENIREYIRYLSLEDQLSHEHERQYRIFGTSLKDGIEL